MKKKKWPLYKTIVSVAIILLLIVAELIRSNHVPTITRYKISAPKLTGGFRVVFLADLHGREFGAGNARLLRLIAAEEPDIIVLAGDLIDSEADDGEVESVCAFISAAKEIAPVYLGMGNHEYNYMEAHGGTLAGGFEQAGAAVLDGAFTDAELNGSEVRIGGYEGYYRTPHMDTQDGEKQAAAWRFFKEFEDTGRFKLLINHIPTNWLDWEYRDKSPVDLVLSGHYHGGIVRIPFTGQGLFVPYVGWFPPYTKGLFEGETATCVLTTGLSGANGWPRLFNPPEIVTVDVVPGE